jgi:hypothetical protein
MRLRITDLPQLSDDYCEKAFLGCTGNKAYPWQIAILKDNDRRLLLNCARQSGKSTTVALLALLEAIRLPEALVVIISRTREQARELFGMVRGFHLKLGNRYLEQTSRYRHTLENGSRIVCLPCKEDSIRGYSHVTTLILDEAARIPEDVYKGAQPMLSASSGRLILLSTPYGKRGFFYNAWVHGGPRWKRVEISADRIAHLDRQELEDYRAEHGESWYRQEFYCSFESVEGLVYPEFTQAVCELPPSQLRSVLCSGKKVGGMDFGYVDPFVALEGRLDEDGCLWIVGEHYVREQTLAYHAQMVSRDVFWHADPSAAEHIAELKRVGFKIRKAKNSLELGIAAVHGRLQAGKLRVCGSRCPNLVHEAGLYRYGEASQRGRGALPEDRDNHALDALRYLVMGMDEGRLARWKVPGLATAVEVVKSVVKPKPKRKWLSIYNEALWTPLGDLRDFGP